jgi:hypothetical protein
VNDPYLVAVQQAGDDVNFSTSFRLLSVLGFFLLAAAVILVVMAFVTR